MLDVRAESERVRPIDGSLNIPLGRLEERIGELPLDRPIVVHCSGGYRSSIAASILRRHRFEQVVDLIGGIDTSQNAASSS